MIIKCIKCGATPASFALEIKPTGRIVSLHYAAGQTERGMLCEMIATCICGEWFLFHTVVQGATRWSRELREEEERKLKEKHADQAEPGSVPETDR